MPSLEECAMPSPERDVDASDVQEVFLLEGDAEVRRVHREGQLQVIALNLTVPVGEAYERYKGALVPPRYETITEDFEGFEFELYLRDLERDEVIAVQGRRPRCEERSAVYVTVDEGRHRE